MSGSGRRGARLTARAVSAALGCVALVSFAAPARAQTTLVSNHASRHASDSLAVGDLTATDNLVQAQQFQTGPRPAGYPLTSVKFRVTNLDAENVSPRVSIYSVDSSGVPGSELYLLSGTVSQGEVTLTAPANAVLAANTGYYVYFEDTDTSEPRGSYRIGLVDDSDTDTGLSGWQLEDRRDQNGNGNWALNTSPLAAIELTGSIVNNAPVFSGAALSRSVEANAPGGQNVGAAIPAATDADNDTLVYSLEGADAASFTFDAASRRIRTRAGVTYGGKGKTSYSVTVQADDGWGGTDRVAVTVTVANMQEVAPRVPPPKMDKPTVTPDPRLAHVPHRELDGAGQCPAADHALRYEMAITDQWYGLASRQFWRDRNEHNAPRPRRRRLPGGQGVSGAPACRQRRRRRRLGGQRLDLHGQSPPARAIDDGSLRGLALEARLGS